MFIVVVVIVVVVHVSPTVVSVECLAECLFCLVTVMFVDML